MNVTNNDSLGFVLHPFRSIRCNLLDLIARAIVVIFLGDVVIGAIDYFDLNGRFQFVGWHNWFIPFTQVTPWSRSVGGSVVFVLLPILLFVSSSAFLASPHGTGGIAQRLNFCLVVSVIGIYLLSAVLNVVAQHNESSGVAYFTSNFVFEVSKLLIPFLTALAGLIILVASRRFLSSASESSATSTKS